MKVGIVAWAMLLASPVPGMLYFAGPIRVRGFELQDYGVFFHVEHPVVRRSILWWMNTLQFNGGPPCANNL